VLENRIEAIERLAASDPGIDANLLESRVLALLPTGSSDSTPLVDAGAGLLALDPPEADSLGSGSAGATAAFAPGVSFAGSPTAVPEPSTLMLAGVAAFGAAYALRRRNVNRVS